MHLRESFQAASLSPEQDCAFAAGLRSIACIEGPITEMEEVFIVRLCNEDPSVLPSTMDALWAHSKLFLTACICLAVIDGNYSVSKARKISDYAHKLGFSAYQLGQLESQLFAELRTQGETLPDYEHPSLPKKKGMRQPVARISSSFYPEELSHLWESDNELISHTESIEITDLIETTEDAPEDVPKEIRFRKR
jgi:hypothetical protein